MGILYNRSWMINREAGEWVVATITDIGIVGTNSVTGEILEIVPNGNKVVELVRECKKLWDSGDIEGFKALIKDKSRRAEFTNEEGMLFYGTNMREDDCRCISDILSDMDEEEYYERIANEKIEENGG